MKNHLKLEELAYFLAGIWLFNSTGYSYGWFFACLLLPDISMLAYLVDPRVGGITYNLFHSKALAIAVTALGIYLPNETVLFIGIILFCHSSMDRIFGYGLKYMDSFHHTHLGWLKPKEK